MKTSLNKNLWIQSLGLLSCLFLFGKAGAVDIQEPTKSVVCEKEKVHLAVIYTSKGKITCELYPDKAPLSVTNFKQLVDEGFYGDQIFHEVIPGFFIHTGNGGPAYTVPAEIGLKHEMGSLAWARQPVQINPDKRSSSSQFYIALDKVSFLDGEFTVFGQVISGMQVAEAIVQGDKIEKIEILIVDGEGL